MKYKFLIFISCLFLLTGCANITIPNIERTDETTAKNVLSSNGIISVVEYEYSDEVESGNVIYTIPSVGEKVSKNDQITIVVSKGPSLVKSKDSRISWYNIGSQADKWEFYNPYIQDGKLYIECYNVTFGTSMKWQDNYNDGKLIGNASINDTFDKTVPVSAKYTKQSWSKNESQSFTLEIPLNDLNVDKPTNMYLSLFSEINGKFKEISVSFTMTW